MIMTQGNKDIEHFILRRYTSRKNRSVEKNMLFTGRWMCFWWIAVLVAYNVILFFDEIESDIILYTNIAIFLLTPIAITGAKLLCKIGLNKKYDNDAYKKYMSYSKTAGSIGVVVGMISARIIFPNISPIANLIVFSALVILLELFFAMGAYLFFYKVHLIRKYCPHLKNKC